MPHHIPADELKHLRELARRQAEIAALPIMLIRRKLWTDVNDGVPGARPPFVINAGTFFGEFVPDSLLRTRTPTARRLESAFLRNIRYHEIMGDDHVCPDFIPIGWHVSQNEFGIEIKRTTANDVDGNFATYHTECPLKSLADGFEHIVKPATFSVDKENTLEFKSFLEECFGDIMPVEIVCPCLGAHLTQRLLQLIDMQTFYTEVYDHPGALHRLMAMLRDNIARRNKFCEDEGLLALNNGNHATSGSYSNFTTRLPKREIPPGGKILATDVWIHMEAQETVGISPGMFAEFVFPYYRDLAERAGLLYWGCCETMESTWGDSVSRLPNLAAVSISKWENQHAIAEMMDGAGVVCARKPDPCILGVHRDLDEDAWAREIRGTLEAVAGKNVPLAFDCRGVNSLHGNLAKVRRAVEIARREIDRFYA